MEKNKLEIRFMAWVDDRLSNHEKNDQRLIKSSEKVEVQHSLW